MRVANCAIKTKTRSQIENVPRKYCTINPELTIHVKSVRYATFLKSLVRLLIYRMQLCSNNGKALYAKVKANSEKSYLLMA